MLTKIWLKKIKLIESFFLVSMCQNLRNRNLDQKLVSFSTTIYLKHLVHTNSEKPTFFHWSLYGLYGFDINHNNRIEAISIWSVYLTRLQ